MTEPASVELARWAAGVCWPDIPPPVRAAARRHLLDGLGCLIAGLNRAEVPALTVAQGLGGPPEATLFRSAAQRRATTGLTEGERSEPQGGKLVVLGDAERSDPAGRADQIGTAAAAFGNAVAMHALDFDDTHAGGLVHPTTVVAPVALAVAQQTGASGAQLLTAYVVGLEVICRLGAAAPHGFHARGLHATSVCGTVAAAVVAGTLLELPADRLADAIGIAASGSSGLLEFLHSGSSTKQLHPGLAAHAGILAARLAAAGATGPAGGLDGPAGLFAAHADRAPDRAALTGELGVRWEAARITVKPYPACQLSHAAIDAAGRLRAELDIAGPSVADLAEIVAVVHPDAAAIVCADGSAAPDSPYAAKFSLAWCVAAMLIDGALPVAVFDDPGRADVVALAHRVGFDVVAMPMPAADQPGELRVRLRNGRQLTVTTPRSGGGPDDPDIEQVVAAKARVNAGASAEPLAAAIVALETAATSDDLLDAVRRSLA